MAAPQPRVHSESKKYGFDIQRVVWDQQYRKRVMAALKRKTYEEREPPLTARVPEPGKREE